MDKQTIARCWAAYTLYQDEIDAFYELPKNKQDILTDRVQKSIDSFQSDDAKDKASKMGLLPIAVIFMEQLSEHGSVAESDVLELYNARKDWFDTGCMFFEKNDHTKVLDEYGCIPELNRNGEFLLTADVVAHLLEKLGFKSNKPSAHIKAEIDDLWDDRQTMLFPETVQQLCKEKNGISFKEFLFCEEYIRTGRITDTAKNLGIGRTTCYEYLKKPDVCQYLEDRRREISEELNATMMNGFGDCFNELRGIVNELKNNRFQIQDKIKAIDIYLKHYERILLKEETMNSKE